MPSFQPVRVIGYHENGRQSDLGTFAGVTLSDDYVRAWPGNREILRRDHGTWRHLDNQGRPQSKYTKIEFTTFSAS